MAQGNASGSADSANDAGSGGRGGGWVLIQFALLAAIGLAPRRVAGLPAWPEPLVLPGRVAGLLLGAAGGGLAVAGTLALGRNLTPFPRPRADAELVQHGVYGVVRHPIYAGLLLIAIGWSLLRSSAPALALSAVLGLFFELKARREERWLEQRFPAYQAYRQRVRGRILPFPG